MLSSATALSVALFLPAILAQSSTNSSTNTSGTTTNTSPATTTTTSATGNAFPPPTVSGTSCGTAQQNFNQCVTKVSKDISNCPSTGYVCLCQTYANLAACYNACPDLTDGATWKDQSHQYCQQANISDTGSIYNQTTPTTATASNSTTAPNTTTPLATPASNISTSSTTTSRTNTTSASTPSSSPSTFARNSANRCMGISSSLVALATGVCAIVFA